MKRIVASTVQQAGIAANVLKLDRTEWRYASRIMDLHGVYAEDIVLVYPQLNHDPVTREVYEFAEYRCRMAMVEPRVIWT